MCDTDAQMINAYTAKTIEKQFFKFLSIWALKENTNKQMISCWCFITFFLKMYYITLYRNMIIYESMNQLLYLLGKKMWFIRTKCPRVPILKYVVSFSERTRHGEPPFHIILITNIWEKISHYSRDVIFENKIIWE